MSNPASLIPPAERVATAAGTVHVRYVGRLRTACRALATDAPYRATPVARDAAITCKACHRHWWG